MSAVSVNELTIRFGGNEVIRGLDLEVQEGEFLVLLGPSGCGKSTLLHSIAGLIEVAGGRIHIGGADMTEAEPAERGIGMVFQSYALYPTMTVEKNMSFGLRVAGLPKVEIESRVQRAARLLQLEPLLARKPAQLSGGQRQRVAIGRALVREAGVFLFDEPLSNLDAKLRTELRRELKLLHRQLGSTMIYVTHDQVEAMTLASRIVVMRGGVIQQIGVPAEVYEQPQNLFVAGFLGTPGINLLPATLELGDGPARLSAPFALDVTAYPFRQAPAAGSHEVVAGIRPEHLRIDAGGAFAGRVQLIEPMGNHQVVWLDVQGQASKHTLAAIAPAELSLQPEQALRFDIDSSRLSLFDPRSERRL